MDMGDLYEVDKYFSYFAKGIGFFGITFVCTAGIWLMVYVLRAARNPLIHVDRARKQKGNDLMVNVIDKEIYLRFIRQKYIYLFATLLALCMVIIFYSVRLLTFAGQ